MERFICIHGHFYQPPRESPWLEVIELPDSASPYHDWHERHPPESYPPSLHAASRFSRGADARGDGVVEFHVPRLSLQPGVYEVSVAAVNRGHTFDYVDSGYELRVRGNSTAEPGLTRMFGEWTAGLSSSQVPADDEVLNV